MPPIQIVWIKKSFRLHDHPALSRAAQQGPVLPLCVVEPEYWALGDTNYRQYAFLKGCVDEFARDLEKLGGRLVTSFGSITNALQDLKSQFSDIALWSHQETGNHWTYQRDEAVRQWCKKNHVIFREPVQFGVWRGAKIDRDHWAKHWDALMAEPLLELPEDIEFVAHEYESQMPEPEALGLAHDGIQRLQTPGREAGLEALRSFLYERGEQYRTDMSSPVTGEDGCSRMSPHLTYGTLSMREIYQATQKRIAEVRSLPKSEKGTWSGALSAFVGRLHWHCHFTQKLELEPELEWLPMARAYTKLREASNDTERLKATERLTAYEAGRTGYPFVDACMRYLRATGWINFRMRAMLMSFASYDLWLPWQKSGEVLARLFTDYEPGIHWPQTQMQSGVTGINAIRIYSPIKQGIDQDPAGTFTRQWVPEIAHLSDKLLQTPWLSDEELDYPPPIVEHREAAREAKSRIWAIKGTAAAKEEAEKVYEKHGSRKQPRRGATNSTRSTQVKKTRHKSEKTKSQDQAPAKSKRTKSKRTNSEGTNSEGISTQRTVNAS